VSTIPSSASLPSAKPPRRGPISVALFIFSVTLLVFAPVVTHSLLRWDDADAIADNVDFKPPAAKALDAIWMHPKTGYHGLYVPLTYTVWWAVAHVAQGDVAPGQGVTLEAAPFHAMNLLFHAGGAMVVFLILRRLVKSDVPAALGALLFALHPLQAEAVSWVSTMYTPLSGLLSLTAALCYLAFSDSADSERPARRWRLYAAATLCFALALLAKPTVIVMPVIVGVIEIVLRRKRVKTCAALLPWVLLGAADAWITRNIHGGAFAYRPELLARPLIATDALAFYMTKLVAPLDLVTDYGRSPLWVLQHRSVWLLSSIPLAVIAIAIFMRRRTPWLTAGVAIFVLGPAAMLGMVPFSFQHFSTVSDRYAYLSLFGAAVIVAYGLRAAQARGWKPAAPVALAAVAVLAVMARAQTHYWHDTETLFAHNLDVIPTSIAANGNLTDSLLSKGEPESRRIAFARYKLTMAEHPDDAGTRSALAEHFFREGRFRDAALLYREAAQITPDYALLHYMLGRCLMELHERDGAIAAFTRALELTPNYYDTDLRLGDLLANAGRTSEAAVRYQTLLKNHPEAQFVHERLRRLDSQAGVDPQK
jgi:hypothetical protein